MSLIINFILTLVLALLLTIPVVGSHFVIKTAGNAGVVAGTRSISEKEINIIPNLRDFNDYVAFEPSPIQDGKYQDTLQLRSFNRQKASYNSLYSIYNMTDNQTLEIEIVTPGLDLASGSSLNFERVMIVQQIGDSVWQLPSNLERGSTLIQLIDVDSFHENEKLLVGSELTQIVAVSPDGLVVTPLMQDHVVGENVYPESIVITKNHLVNPRTNRITLGPGEVTTVDAIVEGENDTSTPDASGGGMIKIPLTFQINEVNY